MSDSHTSPPSSPRPSASNDHNQNNNNNTDQKTWSGAAYDKYNDLYESWVPWAEDLYLRYFTRHNKASYATEDTLAKTKVTGIKQVDTLQDGVNGLVAGQLGQGGLAQPVGDWASREGVNRAERNGKDDQGSYVPSGVSNMTPQPVASRAEAVANGGKSAAGALGSGVKSVGGAVGGLFGGGKKQ